MAAWAAGHTSEPVAWLSLDSFDNSPSAFWAYLLAALRATGAVPDGHRLGRLRPGRRVDETFLRRVAGAVAELPAPVVLVLDDLHEISNPRVLKSLAFFLRYPVSQLRLVVTTRVERALPMRRPRLRRAVVEIRAAELDFTADEAGELLAGYGLRLGPAEAETVIGLAEGWATGLVLAGRLLRDRGTKAGLAEFSGSERTVAAYLTDEVLSTMTPHVRRFLRHMCVAEQLSGDLADALTGDTDGQLTLELLARSNAFVTEIDSPSGWFRCHGLLAGLLRHQVRMETPELFRELHRRASGWFAEQDAVLAALAHAVAAQDWLLVGRLVVTRAGPRIVSVDRRRLIELLNRIPATELSATAALELCSALVAYDRADYGAVSARVARARVLLVHEQADLQDSVEVMARSMDAALARSRGDMAALVEAAEDALSRLLELSPAQFFRAREYRAIAFNQAGVGLFWLGNLRQADTRLRSGMAMAQAVGAEFTQLNAASHLALVAAAQGALHGARRYAGVALDLATKRGWRSRLQVVPAYLASAMVDLEWDDLDAADGALEEGLAAQQADPEPIQLPALRITELRLLLARRRVDAARLVADRVESDIDGAPVPLLLALWLAVARAELELVAGNPDAVLDRMDYPDRVKDAPRMRVCLARAHLALGAPEAAEAVLVPLQRSAPDVAVAVETWVTTSLVEDALRQSNRSVDAFARAVALAEPQNIRRPFLGAERHTIAGLMERYQWLVPQQSPFVAGLLTDLAVDGATTAAGSEADDLTARELDVLRYLPTMLKNQDIAAEMYVSVNTVKAHLRSLYRKLGVTQRREAVERGRELGLL
ncbi:LuxR C-terminal-related transcriptional regulator [Actinoplanes sp. CA-051413]|uniref:LuxR C-terminal-related transcriptional regulator n=1 Tax=Actinoplanes sp. CA-051413 TaxID=3239899 RepID=UPI003D99CD84